MRVLVVPRRRQPSWTQPLPQSRSAWTSVAAPVAAVMVAAAMALAVMVEVVAAPAAAVRAATAVEVPAKS